MGKKMQLYAYVQIMFMVHFQKMKTKRLVQIFKLAKSIIQISKPETKCPQLNELFGELKCQNSMFKNPPS